MAYKWLIKYRNEHSIWKKDTFSTTPCVYDIEMTDRGEQDSGRIQNLNSDEPFRE